MRIMPVALSLLFMLGCADDNRLSMFEFEEMQAELAEEEPVPVRQSDIALSEMRPFQAQSGDVLRLTIVGLDKNDALKPTDLQTRIAADGNIRLPMVGPVAASGKQLGQIEQAIYDAYVPDFFNSVSVHVAVDQANTTTVVVTGAAGRRGIVNLRSDQRNVLYALANAGGFLGTASGIVHVEPARPEREAATYNLNDINDLRRALQSAPLESGDLVKVDQGIPPAVYITGLVNTPGPIVLGPGGSLTVMQAISAGAGLVDFLGPEEATLWRQMENGERVRVKVALSDILAGKAPDLALRAGDILDVPHTASTRFRQWFAENIRLGPFGVTAIYDPMADRRARIVADQDSNALQTIFLNTLNSAIPTLINPTN